MLFPLAIIRESQPTWVHQSVSVGHYLLHPNNREFNQRTRSLCPITGSEHFFWPLTFSTHTVFRPYISAKTSTSFFFSFKIYQETAWKQKRCLGVNLSHEFSQNDPLVIYHRRTPVRSCWEGLSTNTLVLWVVFTIVPMCVPGIA